MSIPISIIAAMSLDDVIGNEGSIPWHVPSDLRRFKAITLHRPVIMGRKTYESLGAPLIDRYNIIVSKRDNYKAKNAIVVSSLDKAIEIGKDIADKLNICDPQVFIIGGGNIYEQALSMADYLYLTRILGFFKGDVYFPVFSKHVWREVYKEKSKGESDKCHSEFTIYTRSKEFNLKTDHFANICLPVRVDSDAND